MDYEIRRATSEDYEALIDFATMVFYVYFPYRLKSFMTDTRRWLPAIFW